MHAVPVARRRRQRPVATLPAPFWGRVAPPRIGLAARPGDSCDGPRSGVVPDPFLERAAGDANSLAAWDPHDGDGTPLHQSVGHCAGTADYFGYFRSPE